MNVDFSIIIPAYNEEAFLQKTLDNIKLCIDDLQDKLKLKGEIIVVDNNSTDETANIASANGAKVVFEPENCIAKARNCGAREASGKYLIFVDADTIVSPTLLNNTLATLLSGKVCGGGTLISFSEKNIPLLGKICLKIWHILIRIFPCAAGSFLFCTKTAFDEIGGFNELYYAAEEIILSKSLRDYGRKHGMSFKILDIPVETSARKFQWFGTTYFIMKSLFVGIFPFLLRKRNYCDIWYQRPQTKK